MAWKWQSPIKNVPEATTQAEPMHESWRQPPSTNQSVILNEGQVNILNEIVPGFRSATDTDTAQDILERIIPGFSDPETLSNKLRSKVEELGQSHQVVAAYGAIYTHISGYRRDVYKDVDRVRRFYLVDVMLNQITEDALAPDSASGEIVNVKSSDDTIQAEIDGLNQRIGFDDLVLDITPDVVAYGEYYLATDIHTDKVDKSKSRGLIQVLDNVQQQKVVAITKAGKIEKYLVENKDQKLELAQPAEYIKFVLGSHKIRVDMHKEFEDAAKNEADGKILKEIPRFIRVGKSKLFPILAKVKELQLLEQLVPAAKLSKMASGTLVGVQLPAAVDIGKAMEAARKIEGMINKKIGIDTNKQELTLESIMSTAGKLKVVPLMGDKGGLKPFDYKSNEPDDLLKSVDDIRRVICASIGIPYEIIFGGGTEKSKGELLKRYARYLRTLKSVQKAISHGLHQIVAIHLANKGIPFKATDIIIEFKNKLIEVDNLDKLEFTDTTLQIVANIKKFVSDLASDPNFKDTVDMGEFKKIIADQLKTVGLGTIIKKDNDPPQSAGDTIPVKAAPVATPPKPAASLRPEPMHSTGI